MDRKFIFTFCSICQARYDPPAHTNLFSSLPLHCHKFISGYPPCMAILRSRSSFLARDWILAALRISRSSTSSSCWAGSRPWNGWVWVGAVRLSRNTFGPWWLLKASTHRISTTPGVPLSHVSNHNAFGAFLRLLSPCPPPPSVFPRFYWHQPLVPL